MTPEYRVIIPAQDGGVTVNATSAKSTPPSVITATYLAERAVSSSTVSQFGSMALASVPTALSSTAPGPSAHGDYIDIPITHRHRRQFIPVERVVEDTSPQNGA